jgi:outer membrane usher protein
VIRRTVAGRRLCGGRAGFLSRGRIALAAALLAQPLAVRAQQQLAFDPAFLELGGGQGGADLSVFAASNRLLPGTYLVDVSVNEQTVDKREIAFEAGSPSQHDRDAEPCLTRGMFEEWGVNVAAFPVLAAAGGGECVDIARIIPGARVTFDSYQHRLEVSVPQAAMKRRARGSVDPAKWDQGMNAALLDYQLSAARHAGSDYDNAPSRTSLYGGLRGGINIGAWRLSHRSSFVRGLDGMSRFQLIDTFVQRDIVPWQSRLSIGEGSTPSNVFDGFQFRGVQLGTDETMLPDSLQGYAPTVHGLAQTNAQVTVRQNGYVIYSTFVPPGPFTLDDLYPTSSSGDLEVTVAEADGRTTKFIQPYSAVPMLLRDGSWRYTVAAGQYRDGVASTHPAFGMATLARGLPGEFSLYGGVIGSNMYQSALIGVGKNLGRFGALSFDIAHARSATNLADTDTVTGSSLRVLYAKTFVGWGTDFRVLGYRYSTPGYRSFADAVQLRDGTEPSQFGAKRERVEGTVNQRLANFGSVYATLAVQRYWGSAASSNLFQLGYASRWGPASYGIYGSYNKGNGVPSSWNVSLSVSFPLNVLFGKGAQTPGAGNVPNVTYFASRDNENRLNQLATLSGTAGEDRQLNYSVGAAHSNESSVSGTASASYLAPFGRFDASAAHGLGYTQTSFAAAGGVVWRGTGLIFSQPLGETVAVVDVPNVRGVHFEMNPGVSTNRAGEAVIPNLNPYRINRIVVSTRALPKDVDIKSPVAEVVPTRGAVVGATFDSAVGHQAAFTLTTPGGKPVPLGAVVENDEGQQLGIVGMDGLAFVSGLPALDGHVAVRWSSGVEERCRADYALPATQSESSYPSLRASCR